MVSHFADVSAVHFFKVAHVFEEDVDVNDMIQIRIDRLKHDLERSKNLRGLREDVISGELTASGVHACRPADGDEIVHFGDVVIWSNGSWGVGWSGGFNAWHFLFPFERIRHNQWESQCQIFGITI